MNRNRKYTWKRSPFDARDADHPLALVAQPIPPRYSLRGALPPCWDQGQEGSCTGHGLAAPMVLLYPDLKKPAPQFIYWNERNLEGTVNQDAGAYGRDGCKVLLHLGVCPDTDDVYNDKKWKQKPSDQAYAAALKHRIGSYHALHSLTSMLQCLASGFPIVFGFEVFESFESDEVAKTGMVPMPKAGEKHLGGHEVAMIGYDQVRRVVEIRNSWSPKWGDQGNCWMPFDYVRNRKLADDFYTLRK